MRIKVLFTLLVTVAVTTPATTPATAASDSVLSSPVLFEDFEGGATTSVAARLLAHKHLELVPGEGVNGSTGLRARYKGGPRGSERITVRIPLGETGVEYSLNYDVRFEPGFQFVKSGKLHGLGPANRVTGGHDIHPAGWSARATFAHKGELNTYVYHQDMPGKYGVHGKDVQPFNFVLDQYYAVTLHVKINSTIDKADGFVHLYVDGIFIERQDQLRLHASTEQGAISQLLFATFHGGHTPKHAPKTSNGDYATVFATFDNFSVFRNKHIRLRAGK